MLENIKILLNIKGSSKDELLLLLIELCKAEAVDLTHSDEYDSSLDGCVTYMVIERYNRLGNEGVTSTSYTGISESFLDGYSDNTMKLIRRHRKLVAL